MKQAKSLLAIWLALILVLAFAPTAWALTGQSITIEKDDGIELIDPVPPATSDGSAIVLKYKVRDGYNTPVCAVTVSSATYGGQPVLEADGSYTLTIDNGAVTGPVTIKLSTTQNAPGNVKITFKAGNGITSNDLPSDITPPSGAKTFKIPADIPTTTGYFFTGWLYSGDNKVYQPGAELAVPTKDETLTAQWAPTFEISYTDGVENEEVFADFKESAKTDGSYKLAAAQTRTGYTFLGWKTSDGTLLAAGASYTPTANVTLTAQWAKSVIITYKEGDPSTDSTEAKYEGYELTVKEPDSSKTPSGKLFTGWSGSDGKTYQPGNKITLGSTSLTLTAQYADKATISFATGTTVTVNGMPSTMEVEQGKTFTAPKAPNRNDSYSFIGWKASWDNKTYQAGATVTAPTAATGTMTALWDKVYYPDYDEDDDDDNSGTVTTYYSIDVSCSSGGTVFPSGTNSVKKGNSLTVTWSPKSGYVIDGVYIDGVLDNSHDGSYTFRNVKDSHTLYVRYVRDSGSSGGSSGSDDTSPKTGDSSLPMGVLLGVGALALTALVVARKRSRA